MDVFFTNYFFSLWGIITNSLIFLIFGLLAYNAYAKRWSAMTGRYFTQGRITWSQYIDDKKTVLVSYGYSVDGIPYNGEIHASYINAKKSLKRYPKGKIITVYYAAKDPAYSRAEKPPAYAQLISTTLWYLILPLCLINIPSIYLYWLVSINQ